MTQSNTQTLTARKGGIVAEVSPHLIAWEGANQQVVEITAPRDRPFTPIVNVGDKIKRGDRLAIERAPEHLRRSPIELPRGAYVDWDVSDGAMVRFRQVIGAQWSGERKRMIRAPADGELVIEEGNRAREGRRVAYVRPKRQPLRSPVSVASGYVVWEWDCEDGDRVEGGQIVASIANEDGDWIENVRAPAPGIIERTITDQRSRDISRRLVIGCIYTRQEPRPPKKLIADDFRMAIVRLERWVKDAEAVDLAYDDLAWAVGQNDAARRRHEAAKEARKSLKRARKAAADAERRHRRADDDEEEIVWALQDKLVDLRERATAVDRRLRRHERALFAKRGRRTMGWTRERVRDAIREHLRRSGGEAPTRRDLDGLAHLPTYQRVREHYPSLAAAVESATSGR